MRTSARQTGTGTHSVQLRNAANATCPVQAVLAGVVLADNNMDAAASTDTIKAVMGKRRRRCHKDWEMEGKVDCGPGKVWNALEISLKRAGF